MAELVVRIGRVDLARRRVEHGDGDTALTPREAGLLAYLADRSPAVVSTDELLVEVWSYRAGVDSRTVVSTVHTLRRKVERDPGRPEHVLTVRGEGYRFVPAPAGDLLGALARSGAIEPSVRRHLALARAEHLAADHPEAALAVLDAAGEDGPLRVALLATLGRMDDAAAALSGAPHRGPELRIEAADLARRRGEIRSARRLLRGAARAERPEVRGRALVRLGVLELDRGATVAGLAALAEARRVLAACRAPRLHAAARVEEGIYRSFLGDVEGARVELERAVAEASVADAAYVERIGRTALGWVQRARGRDREADAELARADALCSTRWEEPGVFVLRALERRLAGDERAARAAIADGLQRDAVRPNPVDAALLLAVSASWDGRPIPANAPPYARAWFRAARGGGRSERWAAALRPF